MRALLDVNVLIALLDAAHVSHTRARQWFSARAGEGWASCPITQNGCVRVMSNPAYRNMVPASLVIDRLRGACASPLHVFWPDDVSVIDPARIDESRLHGPRQLTDAYLLALAVAHGGRLVTFDAAVPRSAVHGASQENLLVL